MISVILKRGSSFTCSTLFRDRQQLTTQGCYIVKRNVNASSNSSAYDADGRTTVRILNQETPNLNLINTYSVKGFRLSNNLFIHGSILLFPTNVYSWNVRRGIDITLESLLIFDLVVPKTKIVVIGYGSNGEPVDSSLPFMLKKKGISCELLPTPNAVTTYNYLVGDSVHVAGAFVPVFGEVKMTERDASELYRNEIMFGEHEDFRRDETTLVEGEDMSRYDEMWRDKEKTKFDK